MAVTGAAARAPTSALFDFKAEIGKHSAAFEKGRVGKAETYIKGGKRPDKVRYGLVELSRTITHSIPNKAST